MITITTYSYVVEYVTADENFHRVTLEAIDAVDAKHLAESLEGGVIILARATRVPGSKKEVAPSAPIHTVRGEPIPAGGLPYGTRHDMDCPACKDTPFTASPRSETYWAS